MQYQSDKDGKYQQLERENKRLRKELHEKENRLKELDEEVYNASEGKKASDKRIIDASKLIKNKTEQLDEVNKEFSAYKMEQKKLLKEKDDLISKLNSSIEALNSLVQRNEVEKKDLNEKYELNLKNHLEQTTLCSQLQDRIDELERELKEVRAERDKFSNALSKAKPSESFDVSNLLYSAQMRIEKTESDYSLLEKQYETTVRDNMVLKEECLEIRGAYDKIIRNESQQQLLNRQLLVKIVDAESRLVEFINGKSLNTSGSSTDTVLETDNRREMDLLVKENNNLLSLLSTITGMNSIPFSGVGSILHWLESERNRLLSLLREERCKCRDMENQLISLRHDYRNLQIDCERLDNPYESCECCYSMRSETDIIVVLEALEEKCSHLSTARNRIQRLEKEKKEIAESLQEMSSLLVKAEEKSKAIEDQMQYKDILVNELKLETEVLNNNLNSERSQNQSYSNQLKELQTNNQEVEELKQQLIAKNKIINDLKSQLMLTMIGNDISLKEEMDKLTRSFDKGKKKELSQCIRSLGECITSFLLSLCTIFKEFQINDFSDSISSRIFTLSKGADIDYTNDLVNLINECGFQVSDSLNSFLRSYDNQLHSAIEGYLSVQSMKEKVVDCKSVNSEIDSSPYMNTIQSEYTAATDEMMKSSFYIKHLEVANETYLHQIHELSKCLCDLLDHALIPSMTSTIISNDYDPNTLRFNLEKERAEKLLWKARAEQLEVLLANTMNNCSCLTDYELSMLSSVVNDLFVFVQEEVNIDFDLEVSFDSYSEEYNKQVRQQEDREPTIMETQVFIINRIIIAFIDYVNKKTEYLLNECDRERELRYNLEKNVKLIVCWNKYVYTNRSRRGRRC